MGVLTEFISLIHKTKIPFQHVYPFLIDGMLTILFSIIRNDNIILYMLQIFICVKTSATSPDEIVTLKCQLITLFPFQVKV